MACMTPSKVKNVRMPADIEAAVEKWCAEHNTTLSQLLLTAALEKIGRPDLIDSVRSPGRPKPESPAPKRSKKKS